MVMAKKATTENVLIVCWPTIRVFARTFGLQILRTMITLTKSGVGQTYTLSIGMFIRFFMIKEIWWKMSLQQNYILLTYDDKDWMLVGDVSWDYNGLLTKKI
ncbi:uncharacterized protein [Rutidosis leptorrhynchoides]|uniref:uncharacterized protein isoform X2 n=1 Tax=Rutidosis leptorrhynchoides TaxID=125765 RepID=UPI003A98D8B8